MRAPRKVSTTVLCCTGHSKEFCIIPGELVAPHCCPFKQVLACVTGEENRKEGVGKPLWWPRVFGVTAPAEQPSAGSVTSDASNASLSDSGSTGWGSDPDEEQEALPSAATSPDTNERPAGEREAASNSSWITVVEELYMEDDLAEDAPAASAASEEGPVPKGTKPTTASPSPAAAPEASTPSTAEHTLGEQRPAASADSQERGSESSPAAAPAEAASSAPASEGSSATDEPESLSQAVGDGAFFVSEATLPWEHLAEASVDEEAKALQQEALIQQEQAVGEGSEVEAFGEVYTSGDVAGSFIRSGQTSPAFTPAPSPSPAPQHTPDPCATALGIPKVHSSNNTTICCSHLEPLSNLVMQAVRCKQARSFKKIQ